MYPAFSAAVTTDVQQETAKTRYKIAVDAERHEDTSDLADRDILYIHTHIHTCIHTYLSRTYVHTYRQTDKLTYIQTDIHTYIHTYIQTDRQTDVYTYIHLGGFSKRYSLKLYKKASFCHKKPQFQTAVTSACLLQNRCASLQKTANQ